MTEQAVPAPTALGGRLLAAAAARPVATVFAVALAVRLLLAVALFAAAGGTVFPDATSYDDLASDLEAERTGTWGAGERHLFRYTAAFLVPVAAAYELFGPVVLAGQVVVALAGAAAAALTARLAREVVTGAWALGAGLVVALLPSQVVWSSLLLKDAFVWAAMAAAGLGVAVASRTVGRRLAGALAMLAVAVVALAFLRQHAFLVVAWAAALASLAGRREGRVVRAGVLASLALGLPWLLGLGPGGIDFVLANVGTVAERRAGLATGATTLGDVRAPALAHLPYGLSVILVRPVPWEVGGNLRLALASVETVLLWWPLLALAAVGVLRGLVAHLRVLAYPALVGAATVGVYALVEGNLGTAYRHRGELVWIVALFAAVGAYRLVAARREPGS